MDKFEMNKLKRPIIEGSNVEELNEAKKETETTEYDEIVPMEEVESLDDVKESENDYIESLKHYNLSNKEVMNLLEAIHDFKSDNYDLSKIYDMLPKEFQSMVIGFSTIAASDGSKMSKKQATKFVMNQVINDAKINSAFNTYEKEMHNTVAQIDGELQALVNGEINKLFDNINKIEVENPEQAERIKTIKKAIDDASTFKVQYDFIDNKTMKKINKDYKLRYRQRCSYYNKKINCTEIKMPDVNELPDIISSYIRGDYSDDIIGKFILLIIESTHRLPLDLSTEYYNTVYVYKLLSQIYDYKYMIGANVDNQDKTDKLYNNIRKCLDKIKEY